MQPRREQDQARERDGDDDRALVAGLLAFAGFVVMGTLAIPDAAPWHPYAGLAQRTVIVTITFPCLVLLAARLHRLAAPAR